MKTLLERAKPQLVAALAKQKEKYPSLNRETEKFLKENYFCNSITWSLWIDLKGIWMMETNKVPDNPWEIFEQA
jgi:hypothetical protein